VIAPAVVALVAACAVVPPGTAVLAKRLHAYGPEVRAAVVLMTAACDFASLPTTALAGGEQLGGLLYLLVTTGAPAPAQLARPYVGGGHGR